MRKFRDIKPECYSPGRAKSYTEIAENDCFTCPERVTCLEFVAEVKEMVAAGASTSPSIPSIPTVEEIMVLAFQAELVYPTCLGTYFTTIPDGVDITPALVDFATKLLNKYGNLP